MAEGKVGRGCFGVILIGAGLFTALTWIGSSGTPPVATPAAVEPPIVAPIAAVDAPSAAEAAHFAQCDVAAAKISAKLALTFDRIGPVEHNIFFSKRGVLTDAALMCGLAGAKMSFSVVVADNPFPPESVFTLAGEGGAILTGVALPKLVAALHRCHQIALKSPDEMPDNDLQVGKAVVTCHAFTRDGGSTTLDVWQSD